MERMEAGREPNWRPGEAGAEHGEANGGRERGPRMAARQDLSAFTSAVDLAVPPPTAAASSAIRTVIGGFLGAGLS